MGAEQGAGVPGVFNPHVYKQFAPYPTNIRSITNPISYQTHASLRRYLFLTYAYLAGNFEVLPSITAINPF